MGGCSSCSGNCGNCGSCTGSLILTPGEIQLLKKLAQFPFLPVARRADSMDPVYLEDADYTAAEYSLILQHLEKKGLISLDYDKPLKLFDEAAYAAYPIRGSMALTERGQKVLELMEYQGIAAE